MKFFYLFSLFLFTCFISFGQVPLCGNHLLGDGKTHPDFPISKDLDSTTIYTIPLVFHILHQNGSENISDLQILDAVRILNEDFQKMNAHAFQIIPQFLPVVGNAKIKFVLANRDPEGNCKNGIEHIYTHESSIGDDYSKLNQWPRNRYLNIWVVDQIAAHPVRGYTYLPFTTEGNEYFRDGVVILNHNTGTIGTSGTSLAPFLTHEIGHYLGLLHLNGEIDGICGDDGIADTPITKGLQTCDSNQAKVCDPNIIENYQNFMESYYCLRMFTKGQVNHMRSILNSTVAERSNLISAENVEFTGVDLLIPNECSPIADFHVAKNYVCLGDSIQFFSDAYNGEATIFLWKFHDGPNVISSYEEDPYVTFSTTGYKKVEFYVSNPQGTSQLIREDYVFVYDRDWSHIGPKSFDLNELAGNAENFTVFNIEDNFSHFEWSDNGIDDTKGFQLINYRDVSGFDSISDEGFYYNRLGGSIDYIITPQFNLSNTSNVQLTFDYAYASKAELMEDVVEEINVHSSTNCGAQWTPRKTITGADLATMGIVSNGNNFPQSNSDWQQATVNFNAMASHVNTIFKIEFEASDVSGNLFIDNINLNGVLESDELANELNLEIYPNPASFGEAISIKYFAGSNPVTFELKDLNGKLLSKVVKEEQNSEVSFSIGNDKLEAGCYLLQVNSGAKMFTKRVLVL